MIRDCVPVEFGFMLHTQLHGTQVGGFFLCDHLSAAYHLSNCLNNTIIINFKKKASRRGIYITKRSVSGT